MPERIIRASEIGQYVFCAKAWYLGAVEGVSPTNVRALEAGASAHAQHGRAVASAGLARRAAMVMLAIGLGLAIAWLAGAR